MSQWRSGLPATVLATATLAVLMASAASAAALKPLTACPGDDSEHHQSKIKLTVYDRLALPGDKVRLSVKAERRLAGGLNPDLRGKVVSFEGLGGPPLAATTGEDGVGAVDFAVPAGAAGTLCFVVRLEGTEMPGRLFVLEKDAPVLVTDIDEVISDLPETAVPLTPIDANPTLPGAPEELGRIAARMRVVYLTARDDALFNKTRAWLRQKGFPAGPLQVWDWEAVNTFGADRQKQGAYKVAAINRLKTLMSKVMAGVGNRPHDAEAYVATGLAPYNIGPKRPGFPSGTIFVADWAKISAGLADGGY